jgi:HSP20 family protein
MANTDRSKQQTSEAPQSGQTTNQQGGTRSGQPTAQTGSWEPRQSTDRQSAYGRGGSNVPAQRGSYEPSWYTGLGRGTGPFALMRRLSDEMDRIFESFGVGGPLSRQFGSGLFESPALQTLWAPHIEVRERDGKLMIQADLPGVRKEDVSVQVESDAVILQGERKQETTVDKQGYYHSERSYGSFHRVIPLPEGVDTEQAKATFDNGVLQIELPVTQPRQRGRTLRIDDQSSASGGQTESGQRGQGGGQQQA